MRQRESKSWLHLSFPDWWLKETEVLGGVQVTSLQISSDTGH